MVSGINGMRLAALLAVLALAGCGSEEQSAPAPMEESQPAVAEPMTEAPAAEPAPAEPEAEAAPAPAPETGKLSGAEIVKRTCSACHGTGVLQAPKIGSKEEWEPRLAQGLDALVASAIKGKNSMPPRGGNVTLDDDEMKAAVEYMLQQSGL